MGALDLVVYGASGFTGRLVCAYLRRNAPASLRWALAGRDAAKLEQVASETLPGGGEECAPVDIIGGCDGDGSAAHKIVGVARPRVVLSTAGPFIKFSDAVVGACAQAGVSYVDIDGEIPWVKRVLQRDDEAARSSGALIVPNCGFDSVPSDLIAQRATQLLAARSGSGAPCVRLRAYVEMKGVVSGGTIETGLLMEDLFPDEQRDPFLLGGCDALARGVGSALDADPTEAMYDPAVRRWVAPFGMAKINTRVVRRSAGALNAYANVDAREIHYGEVALAPGGAAAAEKMARNAAIPPSALRVLRDKGRLPKPGAGPSPERRASSSFRVVCVADAADGERAVCSIAGGDPGYEETAKMVSEAALAAVAGERMPGAEQGGVLTPAAAFGGGLVDRLRDAGMSIDDDFDLAHLPGEADEGAEAA